MWSGCTPAARMPRNTCCAASGRPPAQHAVMSAEYVITLGAHPGSLAAAACISPNTCTYASTWSRHVHRFISWKDCQTSGSCEM